MVKAGDVANGKSGKILTRMIALHVLYLDVSKKSARFSRRINLDISIKHLLVSIFMSHWVGCWPSFHHRFLNYLE
jgi:hypothetical protein